MAASDIEYELVYQGICAVAARCDGAIEEDGVGFNGQDTKFGRRIAAVSFDAWTPDVREEAARIANTYQKQILSYTGIDVTTLDVVKAALGKTANQNARDTARTYERRARGASKVALRKIDVAGGRLGVSWDRGDPDFGDLLKAVQALPGRWYNGATRVNEVDVCDEVVDFALLWDIPITPAAQALLAAPRAPKPVFYNITLHEASGRIIIDAKGYDADRVTDARRLPGREWAPPGFGKVDVCLAHPAVLAFATKWNLTIHPDAQAACELAQKRVEAEAAAAASAEDFNALMVHVSRAKDPNELPAAFLDLLEGVLNHA
jgi:hypothetical protein